MSQGLNISRRLLNWYDKHRRVLPWRALPGRTPNPYAVWLSEIMLQQTTVATVGPYFHKFMKLWPRVEDLAKANRDDVLAAWAGLGYYSRARNLHACANKVVAQYNGKFPTTEAELRELPGIGPYTAAAIAAIAFDASANVVDGNVERVMARLFAVSAPLPAGKNRLRELAATLVPAKRAGDYAQALMDLGATVCTPRSPDCGACPLRRSCVAYAGGNPAQYPRRSAKKARPVRHAILFMLHDRQGRIWMRQRPEKGLLAAMLEFPSSPWQEEAVNLKQALASLGTKLPPAPDWRLSQIEVRHVFTHFELRLAIATAPAERKPAGLWLHAEEARKRALPSLMNKALRVFERDIRSVSTSA